MGAHQDQRESFGAREPVLCAEEQPSECLLWLQAW